MLLARAPTAPTWAIVSCDYEGGGNGPILAYVVEKMSFPANHDV